MSGSQKALKIISIILVVWAALTILMGVLLAAGSQIPGVSGTSMNLEGTAVDVGLAAMVLGVSVIVGGIIDLVIAVLGLRGAKNPAKIGVFFVLCVIGTVLSLVGLVMSLMQGTFQWTSLIGLILVIVCTVLAYQIKKQA